MKAVLCLVVLFSTFIGYIKAEKTELTYRIISPVDHQVIQRDSGNSAWVEMKVATSLPVSKNGPLEYRLDKNRSCLLYTSPSPRDYAASRMPSSA